MDISRTDEAGREGVWTDGPGVEGPGSEAVGLIITDEEGRDGLSAGVQRAEDSMKEGGAGLSGGWERRVAELEGRIAGVEGDCIFTFVSEMDFLTVLALTL